MTDKNFVKINEKNWDAFKNSEDGLTFEPYQMGDLVAKCAACHHMYHAKYIAERKCPYCGEAFVSEKIVAGVVHINLPLPPRPTPRRRWPDRLEGWIRVLCGITLCTSVIMLFFAAPWDRLPALADELRMEMWLPMQEQMGMLLEKLDWRFYNTLEEFYRKLMSLGWLFRRFPTAFSVAVREMLGWVTSLI